MNYSVTLEEIEFQANHGLYSFEKEKGNTFYLTITIQKNLSDTYQFSDIQSTLDYEILYKIVQKYMSSPSDLLEQVLQNICTEVKTSFDGLTKIYTKLSKKNPPIGGDCKCSVVELEFIF
ncbi:MAG: dihydroneopterin aldolase [Bacteroidetes bacterium]|nr:dihydroneopterin aldolase [Bacteroidota bacterium]